MELISSVEEAGRSKACPGETVVFTCTIQATTQLEWWTGPTVMEHVQFAVSEGQVVVGQDNTGEFDAVITRTERNRDNSYIIESTLSVTATDMVNGTTVTCTDGLTSVSNHSQLLLQGKNFAL